MTIVVGYVPTAAGEGTLAVASDEARLREARLVVVSVARGDSAVGAVYPQTSALQHAVAALKASGIECEVRNLERSRDVAEAILGVAGEEEASLIVIGINRRTAVGKLLLGSTAQRVLLDADCPVLAVKAS